MSIYTIWFGFFIANLRYCLFLILHFRILSDICFRRFNLNLIRLHPNLFVIRKSSICCSISFVIFLDFILLCGFLLLSCKTSIPYFRVPVLPLVVYLSGYMISNTDVSYSISSPFLHCESFR